MKRHPSHDYASAGGYFITFSTFDRKPILGQIDGATVALSWAGKIVDDIWNQLSGYYPNLTTDAFQVMPNHVHCILLINDPKVLGLDPDDGASVPGIVKRLKGSSSRGINKHFGKSGKSVWQKGYHERVIRGEKELEKFRYYTETNPLRASLNNLE